MDNSSKAFLYKYLNNHSPVGFESSGQQIWLDYLKPHIDEYFTDNYGTAVAVFNPEADYKVVIEAHADEISWFVNYITDDGYIYVIRNGGSDHQIAPSMKVNVHADLGVVKGVFGWPAIHVRKGDKEEAPSLSNIFVDVGCDSADEVAALGIHPGTVITFDADLFEMNNKFLVGRALDNRIGGFVIAEVARRIKEKGVELPFGLYVVNSVQEEVGLRGAQMIANRIKPNIALITDVCHDTQSPMYDKKASGDIKCGKGPAVTYGPAVHNKVLNHLLEIADKQDITIQKRATSRATGTDTDAFAYSNDGVPSVLASTPLKYMHTTVETAHKEDVQHLIDLIYEFVTSLKGGEDYRYVQ
ncbi:MAG: M42 family metallopeptidase [Bacteroidota bacterium]